MASENRSHVRRIPASTITLFLSTIVSTLRLLCKDHRAHIFHLASTARLDLCELLRTKARIIFRDMSMIFAT